MINDCSSREEEEEEDGGEYKKRESGNEEKTIENIGVMISKIINRILNLFSYLLSRCNCLASLLRGVNS